MKDDSSYMLIGLACIGIIGLLFIGIQAAQKLKLSKAWIVGVSWSLLIAATCIFPPFRSSNRYGQRDLGHYLLSNGPVGSQIYTTRLVLEWLIITAILGPVWWGLKKPLNHP